MLQQLIVCAALSCAAVFTQNTNPGFNTRPQSPTITFNCPRERGQFEYPGNCSRYYECYGGVARVRDCQPQLIFNENSGYCDWPHLATNPNCPGATALNAQYSQMCRDNPGNPGEAFNVGHPVMCNAFTTCGTSYAYPICTFCGEGMYFNIEARRCVDFVSLGQDINTLCGTRQFVPHQEKVLRQLDTEFCWPFANIQNPFLFLLESSRSGTPRPSPNRPG